MIKQREPEEIIKELKDVMDKHTIEGELLKPKLVRELYKILGDPQKEDFPEEFKYSYSYDKETGYTKWFFSRTARDMDIENRAPTNWCIKRASRIKEEIVEKYTRDGWHCSVQSYNVLCSKYVRHPRYKNIWVRFYKSRDCSKYEYVLEEEEND